NMPSFRFRFVQRSLPFAICLASLLPIAACSTADHRDAADVDPDEPLIQVPDTQRAAAQQESLGTLTFDQLTPTSTRIMRGARFWMHEQDKEPRFPRPRMCASNVSKVLFLSGITSYDQEGVRELLAQIGNAPGAHTIKLPRTSSELPAAL